MKSEKKTGQLLLLPNLLDKRAQHQLFLPSSVDQAVLILNGLIAENEKEGRAYLKRFGASFRKLPIHLFNKHNREIHEILRPMQKGETWGLISDVGLPVVADPGFQLVRHARQLGIDIKVFIGPSSLILALMLSGLPAQKFAFHGYLPRRPEKILKTLECRSKGEGSTQIFMETPYRNQRLFEVLVATLSEKTLLSVAWDLTMPTQGVETDSIANWRRRAFPNLEKRPAMFLFHVRNEICVYA